MGKLKKAIKEKIMNLFGCRKYADCGNIDTSDNSDMEDFLKLRFTSYKDKKEKILLQISEEIEGDDRFFIMRGVGRILGFHISNIALFPSQIKVRYLIGKFLLELEKEGKKYHFFVEDNNCK